MTATTHWRKLRRPLLLVLGVLLLFAAGTAGWYASRADESAGGYSSAAAESPSQTEPTADDQVPQRLRATGVILPVRQVVVRAPSGGTVEQLHITEGSSIEKDTMAASLGNADAASNVEVAAANLEQAKARAAEAEAALARAEAQLASAETRLRHARSATAQVARQEVAAAQLELEIASADWERTAGLAANGAAQKVEAERAQNAKEAARLQLELARYRLEDQEHSQANAVEEAEHARDEAQSGYSAATEALQTARANVRSAEASLQAAQANWDTFTIEAPWDGTIITSHVEEGDYLRPGDAVFTLASADMKIRIEPDERQLANLKPGTTARFSPEAYPEQRFDAVIERQASVVDSERGVIAVYLTPAESSDILISNMRVSVEIQLSGAGSEVAR